MKEEFTISAELIDFMQHHGMKSLVDLLSTEDEYLLSMDCFGWRLIREVLILRER